MFRLLRITVTFFIACVLAGIIGTVGIVGYLIPRLPSIEILKDIRLQVPLRVYTSEQRLIAEFGEKRRVPLPLEAIPDTMIKAMLAAEDDRFFEHPGVDWQGLVRAVLHLLKTGEKGPGGSTITMQVARNFFLGREKTYLRKLSEILLALKIEQSLTKEEILELYLNKIFFGHRSYGVGAAAFTYYGTDLQHLTLEQLAMIAALPKAPSTFNPIVNPDRALLRRNYVLRRMLELGFITEAEYQTAYHAPDTAKLHGFVTEVEAPYVAEMVRAHMESWAGPEAYTEGYHVYTTIDSRLQEAANQALRETLREYDERHGYRGPEQHIKHPFDPQEVLADIPVLGGLKPAIVLAVRNQSITAYVQNVGEVTVPWEGLSWGRAHVTQNRLGKAPRQAREIVRRGDVVRLLPTAEGKWRLSQIPAVEGSLLAVDPHNGTILALTGGFDFVRSKFNRVTQAQRQPGSSFKPFIYSAALEKGFTAASVINDAPLVVNIPGLPAAWRPENYSGRYFGPTRLREALVHSRNLVSVRLLRAIGIDYAIEYIQRFGLDAERLPRGLSLALGSCTLSPLELAGAYSVFANGGYRTEPYFIERILDGQNRIVFQANPLRVCEKCPEAVPEGVPAGEAAAETVKSAETSDPLAAKRVIPEQNAWIMNSMLQDVIRKGTARRALSLKRKDLAGKTGTTNDERDAWFAGFHRRLVAVAWVGFDDLRPLGRKETGGRTALPMWIKFMGKALADVPEEFMEQPEGLVTARIGAGSGKRARADQPDTTFETFSSSASPRRPLERAESPTSAPPSGAENITEQLF